MAVKAPLARVGDMEHVRLPQEAGNVRVNKHSEVESRMHLHISMSTMKHHSHLLTTKRAVRAEAVRPLAEDVLLSEVLVPHLEAVREVEEEDSLLVVEVDSVVEGEDGGIGKRYGYFLFAAHVSEFLSLCFC